MLGPHRVAPDTVLIPRLVPQPGGFGYVNSMVITGREPVLVDTGAAEHRDTWLEDVFSVVDPPDVRWIFISHPDPDHIGNLLVALNLCPQATLVTAPSRHAPTHQRSRPITDGESFQAGDRVLTAVRPPLYDAPTTYGLYDDRSGVYWSADCFGAVTQTPTTNATDLPADDHLDAIHHFATTLSPWHAWLDQARFGHYLDHIATMELTAITTAHGPTITGHRISRTFETIRQTAS
ncbi:MBL fold metallo-hydrolase [Acrocarpospora catenulata]|uniref:MBL fold metallo-hydrolase n=1 Tax=Acrocarpospora catenulata TaxID=2836182 RepID=UPI001BDAF1B4|nr:MBL fold metallo-hydrolase [Acrocarpospora catenulata]